MMVTYTCPPCVVCRKADDYLLDDVDLAAWKAGVLIQDAFPYLSSNDREMLISGTHEACFNKLFGDGE